MIFAWIGAILVGLSLGLLGSGGSILTVPILVYLVGQSDKVAIAGSLAIPQARLRRIFGGFLVAMCIYILWRSTPQVI